MDVLVPLVIDSSYGVELSAFAALSLGLIFTSKCNEDAGNAILQTLMDRPDNELNLTVSRYFSVGLGLLFLGQQEMCEATLEAIKLISHPISNKNIQELINFISY